MYVVKNGRSWLFDRQGNKIQIAVAFGLGNFGVEDLM